jgi:hypothetical protein
MPSEDPLRLPANAYSVPKPSDQGKWKHPLAPTIKIAEAAHRFSISTFYPEWQASLNRSGGLGEFATWRDRRLGRQELMITNTPTGTLE